MRDINRIDEFLSQLGRLWKLVPDWRFMQLICNFQRYIGSDGFYLEENKMINMLADFMADYGYKAGDVVESD